VVIFLAARTSLGDTLASRAGPWMNRCPGLSRRCLQLHAVPAAGPGVPVLAGQHRACVAGVPLGTYALTTLIGIIPGTFAFSVLGSGLDSIIEAQKAMYEACIAEKGSIKLHLLA
jgi:uncharacterized membrane protein YdjX (TVP38/TMEM64 family)